MALVTYECCLCGDQISPTQQNIHKLDPCGLVIYANINEDIDDGLEQMFFCHYECFKAAMDPGTRIHLVLEDQVAEKPYFRAKRNR